MTATGNMIDLYGKPCGVPLPACKETYERRPAIRKIQPPLRRSVFNFRNPRKTPYKVMA